MTQIALAETGQAPVALPSPLPGYDASPAPIGSLQTTLDGSTLAQYVAWKRAWQLDFGVITEATYAAVSEWYDGTRGAGPFDLYEGGVLTARVNVTAAPVRRIMPGYVAAGLALVEV